MLKQGKFLGPNVNMNCTKLHEIGNLQMKMSVMNNNNNNKSRETDKYELTYELKGTK